MNAAWLKAAALIALASTVAHAQEQAQDREGEAGEPAPELEGPFALTVNMVPQGDVILVLKGDDVYIDPADLQAAGVHVQDGEHAVVAGRKLVRLASLSPPLRYELDEHAIELRIVAPPELLPRTAIDLAPRPPDVHYPTDTSAFLNYAPRVNDKGRVDLYEEMGLSVDGKLLFSSAYLSSEQDPARGMTHLIVDDRESLTRYTFGDALVRTGNLGAGGFVGGVTVSRNYDLDPYAIKTPRIGLRGSTPTPATIDVLVNGTRVRTEEVAPGTFEITNLNVGGGSGLAGYVIRDVFGNEQYVLSPFYMSSEALNPGFTEYSYSFGVLRHGVGSRSWGYDEPVALAHHRRGLNEHITFGARAEASADRVSAGPSLTAIADVGQVDLDLGGSFDRAGLLGAAAQLMYSYSSRMLGCSLAVRLHSDRYSNLELPPDADRPTAAFDGLLSVPIGSRVTLSYRTTLASARDHGVSTTIGAQSAVRITSSLHWLTSAGRSKRERAPADWEVTTTLSYAFGSGYGAQASATKGSDREHLRLHASKSLPSGEGFGYRASAMFAEEVSGEGQVQYQSLFGRYGARYLVYGQRPELVLDAAGALVVVPGAGVYPTLPVHGSFGLIRVPDVAGVRGYGNHQELGTTDRKGNLVVPNLLSYYGNSLSIAPEDVPLEYEMSTTEMVLAPPPRGVALAEFPIRTPHFYRGRIAVSHEGRRLIPKYGQVLIVQRGEEVLSPLGEEGEFELSGLDAGTHSALVEWADGRCTFEIALPQTQQTVIELGQLTCEDAQLEP